jgi:monoamine oxidase
MKIHSTHHLFNLTQPALKSSLSCKMCASKSDTMIAIVGGGLGGICAAIALGRAGYNGGS